VSRVAPGAPGILCGAPVEAEHARGIRFAQPCREREGRFRVSFYGGHFVSSGYAHRACAPREVRPHPRAKVAMLSRPRSARSRHSADDFANPVKPVEAAKRVSPPVARSAPVSKDDVQGGRASTTMGETATRAGEAEHARVTGPSGDAQRAGQPLQRPDQPYGSEWLQCGCGRWRGRRRRHCGSRPCGSASTVCRGVRR
jgi:hypothetical protein